MSDDWPQGWYQGESAGAPPRGSRSSYPRQPQGSNWPDQPGGDPRGGRDPRGGGEYSGGRTYGNGRGGRGGRGGGFWGRPGQRGRRIRNYLITLVVLILVVAVGSYFWLDGKLNRTVALPQTTTTSQGTNWLITGSDSRKGLSRTKLDQMHAGFDMGTTNSDSIMLLHMGSGKPVLISIPRDTYVEIPGYGHNKINAALGLGGSTLLIKTIENATGLTINHYMGIGFGGLVSVTDDLGGVQMCFTSAMQDSYSGANFTPGCHNLSGAQALSFVRDRHSFAQSDLNRIQDQRIYLKALLHKSMSPGTFLNPFTAFPFASDAASAISVDQGTHLIDLLQAGMALQNPDTGTVPIATAALPTNAGIAIEWDQTKALELFNALKADQPIPAGLLQSTTVTGGAVSAG